MLRGLLGLLSWPAVFGLVVLAGAWVLMQFDEGPVTAFTTAGSLTLAAFTVGINHHPRLYFWWQRVKALRNPPAPAWWVQVSMLTRLTPSDTEDVVARFRERGIRAEAKDWRTVALDVQQSPTVLRWDEANDDSWTVIAEIDYPTVPYWSSTVFLKERLLPAIEAIESVVQVYERAFTMQVRYESGHNPFEGILVRAAPGSTVTSFNVVLAPEKAGTGSISISRSGLTVTSSSRVAWQEIVERLLALDGGWPAGVVAALR